MSSDSQITVKIKVNEVTPRLTYVCDFVFKQRSIDYSFIRGDEEAHIDYTFDGGASELLYDENLERRATFDSEAKVYLFNERKDYFASIFYVLTRMEEYTATIWDHHDRFTAEQSELKANGILEFAICDRWAEHILNSIDISVQERSSDFEVTFDIDNTYAYKHKLGIRRTLSIMRDRVQNNKKRLRERKEVESGGKDPYDTFTDISSISEKFKTRVFWLVESHGKYDRNLDVSLPEHQNVIKEISEKIPVGIHPSYKSFCSPSMVEDERKKLEAITGSRVNVSRQHFLRFKLPDSYRTLLKAGIKNDYTMGFADATGFRAGTARSFPWYDLLEESITELIIHPFVYMDGTLNEYLKLTPEAAKDRIKGLHEEVKHYGGTFRCIWHNETIGDYNHWKGWRSVLDYTLSLYHE